VVPLELYPFRFRDPRTGKWVCARYRATLAEIEARYREWEIDGAAEIRGDARVQMFHPAAPTEKPPQFQPHLEAPPSIEATERFLVQLFLRRDITWCARRRRFAQMEGAARLSREVFAVRC
jgi:hypothetical protein